MKINLIIRAVLASLVLLLTAISCDVNPTSSGNWEVPEFNIFPDGGVSWDDNVGNGSGFGSVKLYYLENILLTDTHFIISARTTDQPGLIFTSVDGNSWEKSISGFPTFQKMIVVDSLIYGIGKTICASSDALEWTNVNLKDSIENDIYYEIIKSPNLIIVGGQNITRSQGVVLTSPDGENWTRTYFADTKRINKILYINSEFYVFGYNYLYTSNDGSNWARQELPNDEVLIDIIWDNDRFLGLKFDNMNLECKYNFYESTDAVNWNRLYCAPDDFGVLNIEKYDNKYFVMGSKDAISTSEDGINWKSSLNSTSNIYQVHDLTWNGNIFVAISILNTVYISENGYDWEVQSVTN